MVITDRPGMPLQSACRDVSIDAVPPEGIRDAPLSYKTSDPRLEQINQQPLVKARLRPQVRQNQMSCMLSYEVH